jgi:hypothetical protein
MKKIMLGLVAMSSLVFGTGCGGDDNESICEDFYNSLADYAEKGEDCNTTNPPSDSEIEAAIKECKSSIESCTDEDKEKIQKVSDCISDIDECREEDEDEFTGALFACLIQAGSISESCEISADTGE